MPSQTKYQSRLQQIRRINERAPVDYRFNAFIYDKPNTQDQQTKQLFTFHTTDAKTMRRYQRYLRRAMQCRRFEVLKPQQLQMQGGNGS